MDGRSVALTGAGATPEKARSPASMISRIDANRSSGDLLSMRDTSACTASGTSMPAEASGGGASWTCCCTSSAKLSEANGGRPVSISWITAPSAY
ncbi:MAG: hypothetical protein QM820_13550 [Minicystis sp.]